jgi:hypothetical protein
MKPSTKTIPTLVLGALTVAGLVLLCVFSANNFTEANRLQKVFDTVGDAAVLNAAYIIRYAALLYFLWYCLGVIVAWQWADLLLIHPYKRNRTNILVYVILTLLAAAVGIAFALLQGQDYIMEYAYVYMLISIAVLLVLVYIGSAVLSKNRIGDAKADSVSTD